MKIALLGSKSKLSTALLQYIKSSEFKFKGLSRIEDKNLGIENIGGSIFEYDKVINTLYDTKKALFLIGSKGAPNGRLNMENVLLENSMSLAHTVSCINNINYKGEILFFSTAHIYQLSSKKCNCYGENDLELNENLYRWIKDTAYYMLDRTSKLRDNMINERELLKNINQYLRKNPYPFESIMNNNNYYYIYELSKLIGEEILKSLDNKIILRTSYCYGHTDNFNIVSHLLNNFLNEKTLYLEEGYRDMMYYSDLSDIIVQLLKENFLFSNEQNKIVNIVTGENRSTDELISHFKKLQYELNLKFEYKIHPKKREKINYSSALGKNIIKRNFTSFEDGFNQILFQKIITNRKGLKIITEYEGGSYARVYKVKDNSNKNFIFKIAYGNGAENGNVKISKEMKQLIASQKYLNNNFKNCCVPKIYDYFISNNITFDLMEYLEQNNLGECIVNNILDKNSILNEIKKLQNKLMEIYTSDTIKATNVFFQDTYSGRISRRINNIILKYSNNNDSEAFINAVNNDKIIINNIEYINPSIIFNKLKDEGFINMFEPKQLGFCVSGDLILDNVFFNNDSYSFIDSRGDIYWNDNKPYFDPLYDLGKIYFYFAGWKLIRLEQFEIFYSNECSYSLEMKGHLSNMFEEIQYELISLFYMEGKKYSYLPWEDKYILRLFFIIGCHFISDTYPRVVGKGKHKWNQALAEYLIGTIILNNLYNYLSSSNFEKFTYNINNIGMWQYDRKKYSENGCSM